MTVVFTSGSTGEPKGAILTHRNVGTDVEMFDAALNLTSDDVLMGILPFFHSFGFTVTIWAALMLDPKVVYHYNPLEARQVGALARQHGATILVATPTFLRTYVRRCRPEDFATLNLVVTGAEKLPKELADAFEQRFGIRPLEGYGATELSPAVACNIPANRSGDGQPHVKEGTVGRPLGGIQAKVVDLDTGRDLGPGQSGMLLVNGPNVMKGYLGQPELTAQVIHDGWYTTGDIAEIDAEGYIRITGRESRFSKLGGEMVPHVRVEEALGQSSRSMNSVKTWSHWPSPPCPTSAKGSGLSSCTRACPSRPSRFAANSPRRDCRRSGSRRPTVFARWNRSRSWGRARSISAG